MKTESSYKFTSFGKSGEKGRFQFMPKTWELFSKEITGKVLPFTEVNEEYVATKMIQKYLNRGLTAKQIALKWNQGHTGECSSGVNSMGVEYDSCAYTNKVISYLGN